MESDQAAPGDEVGLSNNLHLYGRYHRPPLCPSPPFFVDV